MVYSMYYNADKGVATVKTRKEADPKYTWNLDDLYRSDKECLEDLDKITAIARRIADMKGRITSGAGTLLEALRLSDEMGILADRVFSYIKLYFDSDMGEPLAKDLFGRSRLILTDISEMLAFVEPELLTMAPETFSEYADRLPDLKLYEWYMKKLFRQRAHVLSAPMEELMSRMSSVASNFDKIFDDLTVNDIIYPEIPGPDGQTVTANEANYRRALESDDRDFRRLYYDSLLGSYKQFVNTICSALAANTHYHALAAKSRDYASSLEKALAPDNIPLAVYDNLIATLRDNLAPLQDYLSFRREALGYSDLHFYDLFAPLAKGQNNTYSYEQAKEIALAAVAPLGADYQSVMRAAFDRRWIDVYPNKGKATGAYAAGVYGAHPYSLLNFNGTHDDIFTIAHELGHVMHSYYSDSNQPFVHAGYSIFTAEVASTVNECLLFHYLLEKSSGPSEKAYLLSRHLDSIRSTLYRQGFFADFERDVHKLIESGQPATPEVLCSAYRDLYELYYGKDFTIDESLTYEWSRIPHFYRPFYVYQYATGISAAICLTRAILSEGAPAVDAYLRFLKSGGSKDPIDLLKEAGVDLSTTAPVEAAVAQFAECLAALKESMA